jgi:hypothetical protein
MLAESSNDARIELNDANVAAEIAWPGRFLMVALNALPLLHVAATVLAILRREFLVAIGILYLAPPLIARIVLAMGVFKETRIAVGSAAFFRWWILFQLQVIFCRLPALEEILRLAPGLYSFWLRLWGSRVGRLTYWAPGMLLSDRSFLTIGNDVVFGAGVRLIPHLIQRAESGKLELCLANIVIGDGVMIGGFSILSAGTVVHAGQTTRAALLSPPFTVWKNGKRVHNG